MLARDQGASPRRRAASRRPPASATAAIKKARLCTRCEAEREIAGRALVLETNREKEDDRRDQAERVLDPGRLHRLAVAHGRAPSTTMMLIVQPIFHHSSRTARRMVVADLGRTILVDGPLRASATTRVSRSSSMIQRLSPFRAIGVTSETMAVHLLAKGLQHRHPLARGCPGRDRPDDEIKLSFFEVGEKRLGGAVHEHRAAPVAAATRSRNFFSWAGATRSSPDEIKPARKVRSALTRSSVPSGSAGMESQAAAAASNRQRSGSRIISEP